VDAVAAGHDVSLLDLHPGNHAYRPEILAEAPQICARLSHHPAVRRWFERYLRSWVDAGRPTARDEPLTGDVDQLRELLNQRLTAVAAARSLWSLGEPVDEFIPPLLDAVDPYEGPAALQLLTEIRAVQVIPRLKALAAQDQRITGPIIVSGHIVWDDEQLRDQIIATIAALQAPASDPSSAG